MVKIKRKTDKSEPIYRISTCVVKITSSCGHLLSFLNLICIFTHSAYFNDLNLFFLLLPIAFVFISILWITTIVQRSHNSNIEHKARSAVAKASHISYQVRLRCGWLAGRPSLQFIHVLFYIIDLDLFTIN